MVTGLTASAGVVSTLMAPVAGEISVSPWYSLTGPVTSTWSPIRGAVAVEPFVAIDVAPGAEQRWSWRYRFTER